MILPSATVNPTYSDNTVAMSAMTPDTTCARLWQSDRTPQRAPNFAALLQHVRFSATSNGMSRATGDSRPGAARARPRVVARVHRHLPRDESRLEAVQVGSIAVVSVFDGAA